jgi:hypothetical protein
VFKSVGEIDEHGSNPELRSHILPDMGVLEKEIGIRLDPPPVSSFKPNWA